MENCPECHRYDLEIQNLEQGLQMAKSEARTLGAVDQPREERDQEFTFMLSLAHRLDETRKNFMRHRKAHLSLQ
jgi:hypothetical protein